ncbi:hypothetical protein BOW02_12450 [Solemya velum gill symbiont]|nr:hypothetical protein BOW02_12450 [Solemya velum gill symbiont]
MWHFRRSLRLWVEWSFTCFFTEFPAAKEFKFLGLLLDPKFTFLPIIYYIRTKCRKSMDILKFLSSTDWGFDRYTLLMLYRAIVLSKLG